MSMPRNLEVQTSRQNQSPRDCIPWESFTVTPPIMVKTMCGLVCSSSIGHLKSLEHRIYFVITFHKPLDPKHFCGLNRDSLTFSISASINGEVPCGSFPLGTRILRSSRSSLICWSRSRPPTLKNSASGSFPHYFFILHLTKFTLWHC